MHQDYSAKYNFLKQINLQYLPVSVCLFENIAINATKNNDEQAFNLFSDRIAYFSELIMSRNFGNILSIEVAPSYTHFNQVDTLNGKHKTHDLFGFSANAKIMVCKNWSVMLEYDTPLNAPVGAEQSQIWV